MNREALLVAHVALDRDCLAHRRAPTVSSACGFVLNVLQTISGATTTLAATVAIESWQLSDAERRAATLLARDAMALTAADLALVPRDTLLSWLGATPCSPLSPAELAWLEAA